ncbi:MAG TPA: hypothetical protein VGS19_19750 [Streptosporangiaceae bacterium]|nr:hypothetical protein [Streptosporangiaceae bacterium]
MVALSREAFDAIEFDAACSGDHVAAARAMTQLADTGVQTQSMPRSEAYVRAGEQWLLADDPAAAARGFLRALEDGGPASVDPRAPLARALFMLGQAPDAESLIGQLAHEPPRDARMCDLLAELLVERGDLPGALAWATAGVELCLGKTPAPVSPPLASEDGSENAHNGHVVSVPRPLWAGDFATPELAEPETPARRDENELRLLLRLRFRIRNDLGLPEDDYDRLLDGLL